MPAARSTDRQRPGIIFGNRIAFYAGCSAIAAGVLLHLPMFISSASTGFKLAGMPLDPEMLTGMGLIVLGLIAAVYGIYPSKRIPHADGEGHLVRIAALDDVKMGAAHWTLIVVLAVALVVDVMKPASLGFVVPGMITE